MFNPTLASVQPKPLRSRRQAAGPIRPAWRRWSLTASGLAWLGLCLLPGTPHAATRPLPLKVELRLLLAECGGRPVRDRSWVAAHLAAARKLLRPHGIELGAVVETFRPQRCALLDASQRHQLARHVAAATPAVTVLIVERIRDLDVPSYNLMGVHWRYRGATVAQRGKHWVYLTARATPPVLAHELCHYFGLRHERSGGNLMTPGPSDPAWRSKQKPRAFFPRLSPRQITLLRQNIQRHLARHTPHKARPRAPRLPRD